MTVRKTTFRDINLSLPDGNQLLWIKLFSSSAKASLSRTHPQPTFTPIVFMFKQIALISTLLTWPLISFGTLVRLEGAGLACPDWPLCYGKIIPPYEFKIMLEVGHRLLASCLGLFILTLLVMSFRPQYKKYRRLSFLCFFLVCIQGILGGLTVIMHLSPTTVVLHLLGGNFLFGLLIYLTYTLYSANRAPQTKACLSPLSHFSKMQGGMLLLFSVILISGGINSSTYSGYACSAFPGCQAGSMFSFHVGEETQSIGTFLPQFLNEWIHMSHRLIAILGSSGLAFLGWYVLFRHHNRTYRTIAHAIWILLATEILVGIANAVYYIPVPVSLFHTTLAATIFGLLSFSFAKSVHEPH